MSWSKEKRSTKRRSSKRRSDKRGSNEMRSIKRSSIKRTSNREQVECKKKVEQWNVGKEKVDTENIGRSKEVRMIEGRIRGEDLKLLKKSCKCNQVCTNTPFSTHVWGSWTVHWVLFNQPDLFMFGCFTYTTIQDSTLAKFPVFPSFLLALLQYLFTSCSDQSSPYPTPSLGAES